MAALETAEARSWRLQQWVWLVAVVCGVFGVFLSYHGSSVLYAFRLVFAVEVVLFGVHVVRFGWPKERIAVRWLLPLLLFWFVWAAASVAWSIDRSAWTHNLFLLTLGLVSLGLTALYSDDRFLPRMMAVLLATVVLSYFIAFWENLTGHHLSISTIVFSLKNPVRSVHPTAWFHNENDYASYLAILTPWFLPLAQTTKRRWLRWLSPVLAGIGIYFIIATSARIDIIAVGIGLLVFLLLHLWGHTVGKALITVVVAIAVSQLFVYALPSLQTAIFRAEKESAGQVPSSFSFSAPQVTGQLETLNNQNFSMRTRIALIRKGLGFLVQTKGIGVGAGNIDAHYERIAATTGGITNPHNWWAEVLFNYGILVAAAYVFLYLWTLYHLFLLCRRGTGRTQAMAAALFSAMIAFFFASIAPSAFISFIYQWVVFGAAIGLINLEKRKGRLSTSARGYPDMAPEQPGKIHQAQQLPNH